MSKKPIVFLDIDGVLNPIRGLAHLPWRFEPQFRSSFESGGYSLDLSREMGKAILDLDCDVRWLTSWGHYACIIGEHMGWDKLPVVATRDSEQPYWKVLAVKKELSVPGPPLVWMDDDANLLTSSFGQDNDPHNRLKIICPKDGTGLTPEHINQAKAHILPYNLIQPFPYKKYRFVATRVTGLHSDVVEAQDVARCELTTLASRWFYRYLDREYGFFIYGVERGACNSLYVKHGAK